MLSKVWVWLVGMTHRHRVQVYSVHSVMGLCVTCRRGARAGKEGGSRGASRADAM
jgi:hypothetical protein